jgi:hypothetical protein
MLPQKPDPYGPECPVGLLGVLSDYIEALITPNLFAEWWWGEENAGGRQLGVYRSCRPPDVTV